MRKILTGIAGVMMVLSLAACTPTVDKAEETIGEIETTAPGGKEDKVPDTDAPVLDIVSIYHYDDNNKLNCEMDGVGGLGIYSLFDKLIEYGVFSEDATINDFQTEGESSQSPKADAAAGPGAQIASEESVKYYEAATLDLSEAPVNENGYQAIANTVCENMNIGKMTILVNGEVKAEDLKFQEVK